jgi:hypothetical protein
MLYSTQNTVTEWSFSTTRPYRDAGNEIELDVIVRDPAGHEQRVPAFWAGEQEWRVRYASALAGRHTYRTVCSDAANPDLHGREGEIEVRSYEGNNALLRHGRLHLAADRRHLEHADGTPFFWLGDTWWMGFTKRLPWPQGFQELAADRVAKGFSLVQIVAGLYPDMPPFDERGANEAGFPWEKDFTHINPAYFDQADLRIAHLIRVGLVPCIVGSWGYFMDFAGMDVLKKHWRNMIARWGAYPVVWCAAGEALMEFYVKGQKKEEPEEHDKRLRKQWGELIRTIRAVDPFCNPVTIHPTQYGHEQVDDPAILDVDMMQTGHSGYPTLAPTIDMMEKALGFSTRLPVIVGEVNYEGILETNREEIQRHLFWTCMLSGAAGHTYGANGLWQVNEPGKPYGPSPHGMSWGDIPWNEAAALPGSGQLGLAKKLLERYPWARFETHLEWFEPHQTPQDRLSAYCAGVPGVVRLIYFEPPISWMPQQKKMKALDLQPGKSYHCFYWNPKNGIEYDRGDITADAAGELIVPMAPMFQDWIFVIEG